jgi:hypothetical protein
MRACALVGACVHAHRSLSLSICLSLAPSLSLCVCVCVCVYCPLPPLPPPASPRPTPSQLRAMERATARPPRSTRRFIMVRSFRILLQACTPRPMTKGFQISSRRRAGVLNPQPGIDELTGLCTVFTCCRLHQIGPAGPLTTYQQLLTTRVMTRCRVLQLLHLRPVAPVECVVTRVGDMAI